MDNTSGKVTAARDQPCRQLAQRFQYVIRRYSAICLLIVHIAVNFAHADNVFIYSTNGSLSGINLTLGTENLLTNSPFSNSVNALAANVELGVLYYGDGTRAYLWDPALGSGAAAHVFINDFSTGPVTAPIQNINSGGEAYNDGKWYIGSEANNGRIQDIYEVTMSADGRSVVSAQPLNLLAACGCSGLQIGGFGDIAVIEEGGDTILYGSSADLSNNGAGTSAGRWRFNLTTNNWTFLAAAGGGQLSPGLDGTLYTNVGNSVRTLDPVSGATGGTSLFTTGSPIYDFTRGFNVDFGDAIASYDAAMHSLPHTSPATIYMGSQRPDNEAGSLNSFSGGIDSAGDDNIGIDDEDAVGNLPSMDINASQYSVSLTCTAGASLAGWIDFNRNGSFDATERNSNFPQICSSGQTELTWSGLGGAVAGSSVVRLRTSSQLSAISAPTGLAPDGEAEDHSLQITQIVSGNCPAGDISSVYTANDLPQAIGPNANSITLSTITVPANAIITDINVLDVQGTHSWINDLSFRLQRGTTTRNLYGPSCGSQNNFSFGFDDETTGTPPCPPTDGNAYPPSENLQVFDGEDAIGDWTLSICDRFNQDGGQLNNWALEVCSSPVLPEAPDIRLGKSVNSIDRSAQVTLLAVNSGDVDLSSVQITDNLDAVFGSGNYSLPQPPELLSAPAAFAINPGYTGGAAASDLLAVGGVLAPGEEIRILIHVNVIQIAGSGPPGEFFNQASSTGLSPAGTLVNDLSGNGLDVLNDQDDPTPIVVDARMRLSGTVFTDTSIIQANAHDGLQQIEEPGLAGRLVTAVDNSNGIEIVSDTTDGVGHWELFLDADYSGQAIEIVVSESSDMHFISEAPAHSTGSVADGRFVVIPLIDTNLAGLDVGLVLAPQLSLDQSGVSPPNSTVQYAHQYLAPSFGTAVFTLSSNSIPSFTGWSTRLLRDSDCNGVLDSGDTTLSGPIAVAIDEIICVVIDVFVPAGVVGGAKYTVDLNVVLAIEDLAASGHSVEIERHNIDITTVVELTGGRLVLDKTVRNISLGESEVTSNTALPGHILEYTIRYTNQGVGAISDLVINDQAPAFSQVLSGSVQCTATPVTMNCTPATALSAVSWDFTGALGAGDSGVVQFQVAVE